MATYSISGHIFLDNDEDQFPDIPDPGVRNCTLTVKSGAFPIATGTSDVNGNYFIDMDAFGPGAYTIEATAPVGETITTATPVGFVLLAPGTSRVQDFGCTGAPGKTCLRVASSWIWKVCWVPGKGVQVTFHHRGMPYFTCYYPGTTYNDYQIYILAASMGKHEHKFYYHRPYIPAPLDP